MPGTDQAEALRHAAELEGAARWGEAEEVYGELFRDALRARDLAAMVAVLRAECHLFRCQGRFAEALELAELRLEIARASGLENEAARATNMVAVIVQYGSDLRGARELYRAALDQARRCRDDDLVGTVCQNLGVVCNIVGDLDEARVLYLESIGASVRSGNRANAMMAYNNLGILCADLREWLESKLYFDRGIELAERLGDTLHTAKLHLNLAEPLIAMGELSRAERSLDTAVEHAARIEHRGTLVDAARFRAVIARLRGDLDAADRELARALELAEGAGLELERANTLGGLARLRQEQGRRVEAQTAARAARDRFRALGAQREIRRLDEVLAEWSAA